MKKIAYIFVFAIGIFFSSKYASAQVDFNSLAVNVSSTQDNIPIGSLICQQGSSYGMCDQTEALLFFGVSVSQPAMQITNEDVTDSLSVMQSGEVRMRVSTTNGPIAKGDRLTTSTTPGVAQKADEDGGYFGFALEAYEADQPGEITGLLGTQAATMGLTQDIKPKPITAATNNLRYIAAAVIVVTVLAASLYFLRRISQSGIEAIGRNPLARKSIQFSLAASSSLVLALTGLGLLAGYLLITI